MNSHPVLLRLNKEAGELLHRHTRIHGRKAAVVQEIIGAVDLDKLEVRPRRRGLVVKGAKQEYSNHYVILPESVYQHVQEVALLKHISVSVLIEQAILIYYSRTESCYSANTSSSAIKRRGEPL